MIKRIRVWKIIALSIVTLGIYNLVWFALRRDEMIKEYKVPIPHWWWYVVPTILTSLFLVAFIMVPFKSYTISDPLFSTALIALSTLLTAYYAVYLWWVWQFGKAVEKITQGRLTLGWIIIYAFMLGPVVQYVIQYYFNRLPKTVDIKTKKYKPSPKFVKYSIIAIVASFIIASVFGGILGVLSISQEIPSPQLTKEQYSKMSKANELSKKYDDCINKLTSDFPAESADSSQEEAYGKAYDHCESIRIEQNAAADAYNKSIGQ